jgi:cytochrome P450
MTDTAADPAELDGLLLSVFMTPEGKADPYPAYAKVREATNMHQSSMGVGVLTRYQDCYEVLRDNRFGRGEQQLDTSMFGISEEEFRERFPRFTQRTESMLGLDPPDHTRIRGLVAKAFTPRAIEGLRPRIQRLTDELLDQLEGEVDVIPDLALKLPITVIGEMLGVPQEDHAVLLPSIRVVIRSLGPTIPGGLEGFSEIYEASNVIDDYFKDLVSHKRGHPEADMLTELIHVEEAGDMLSEAELLATIMLLFVAGYETTTNLIGNGLQALLLHPDQLRRLRDDRSFLKSAVDEMLRYDSPVQLTGRAVLADGVTVAGRELAKGDQLITLLGSANRDPRAFTDPDTFDISRSGPAPLSFSAGIHYCLGASLARTEGQVVFGSLVDQYRDIEPAWSAESPPRYRDNVVLRGLETLPVRLHRS